MGGNATINGYKAQPIPNKAHIIEPLLKDIQWIIDEFNKVKINMVPSGSTEHMFTNDIPYWTDPSDSSPYWGFSLKETYGDIDLMFDCDQYDNVMAILQNTLNNFQVGNLKLRAVQKTDQIITIWQWGEYLIQIDFEPSEFVAGEPTEWAKFCHSSPMIDLQSGVKGVFHKHLLRALNAPDVKDVLIKNSKGLKETKSSEYAMSVSGLRRKLYPVIVKDRWKQDQHLSADRRLVYHEPKGKDWVTDLGIIFAFYFGKEQTADINPKKMGSFTELANMIKKTRSPDDCLKIMNGFINTIWGQGAQKLYRDNDKKDEKEKQTAFQVLAHILNVPMILWENAANVYYGRKTEEYQSL